MIKPVFVRPSSALRKALDAHGPCAARACLVIGLLHVGADREVLASEWHTLMASEMPPALRQALEAAWAGETVASVGASTLLATRYQPASTLLAGGDGLLSVGMDV